MKYLKNKLIMKKVIVTKSYVSNIPISSVPYLTPIFVVKEDKIIGMICKSKSGWGIKVNADNRNSYLNYFYETREQLMLAYDKFEYVIEPTVNL
jgi:hypothetical protein